MKSLTYLICSLVLLLVACKKDTDSGGSTNNGGVYIRRIISPPAGYTFPRTFTSTYQTKDYNMYANAMRLASPDRTTKDLWGDASEEMLYDKIILVNNKTIRFVDSDGEEEDAEYYFTQDSLIIKYTFNNQTEEFAFAKGGYNGFETTGALLYYSYRGDSGNGIQTQTETPGFANLAYALKTFNLNSISDLKETDTLAFANNYYNFK